jgi:glycosyltransferase involved in cell wall biosynthesis
MLDQTAPVQLPFPIEVGDEWPMIAPANASCPELPPGLSWPKISIVTPSFNQGNYLEKTIRSVLLQGYPNLEYLIIDGGSTDQSVEVIKKYEPWIDFWVSEKDRGQSHAINKGLAKTSGELLGWLNSDDYYLPGALFKVARAYLEDTSVGAIYGQGHVVDEKGAIVHIPKLVPVTKESLFGWCFGNDFMQPSCLFTRKAWQESGSIDETLNFALDVEFWIRIADRFTFKRIPDVLSIALSHPLAKTTSMINRGYAEFAIVLMRHGAETYARRTLDLNQVERDGLVAERNRILNSMSWKITKPLRFIKLLIRDPKALLAKIRS